jgi:hypothetical protein
MQRGFRLALALMLVFSSLIPNQPPGPLGDSPGYRPLSSLAVHLKTEPTAVTRDNAHRAGAELRARGIDPDDTSDRVKA